MDKKLTVEGRSTDRRLVLEIALPGFWVEGNESEEDIEQAMALDSEDVIVVFKGFEGDSPGSVLRSLEGRIKGYAVK